MKTDAHLQLYLAEFFTELQYNTCFDLWCLQNYAYFLSLYLCYLGTSAKLPKTIIRFVTTVSPSVRIDRLGYHWTDFHKIWYLSVCRNCPRKFKFHSTLSRTMGTLRGELCTFV